MLLLVARSTYSTIFNLIWFVLISYLRANNGLLLVIASIGLLSLLIYLTSAISRLLYNCRRYNVFHGWAGQTGELITSKTHQKMEKSHFNILTTT